MRFKFTLLIVSVAAVSLTGCASVQNISLDKSQAGPIKTVALLGVSESKRFMVRDLSGLPALGGAIGGAISGNIQAQRAETFLGQYNRGDVKLAKLMAGDLQQNLAKGGLDVSYLPSEAPKAKDGVDDYSHISTTADAILNVWFGATGYVAAGAISADYEPWLVVNARLLNGKTKQVLYQKTFTGGYEAKIANAVLVPCGTTARFATFDTLMENFGRAIEGLTDCQKAIAQRIAEDLK